MKRTHTCGVLTAEAIGQKVILTGWVSTRRDHGGLLFIDLRDEAGVTQIVFHPDQDKAMHACARDLRAEYVICIEGEVRRRPAGTENKKLPTGEIEVGVSCLDILNPSKALPFELDQTSGVSEEVRLTYRYLDLKAAPMQKALRFRSRLTLAARLWLAQKGFVEVETPVLTRSTPEGARDYLVPARLLPGSFYALPQSPQLFKQVLVTAGFEKYFQMARCFRDEDLRADRQPEHTQLDFEMAFVDEEDVMGVIEGLVAHLFQELLGIRLSQPFRRIGHAEALARYGTDKPDTRFGLELADVSDLVRQTELKVFHKVLERGGVVLGLSTEGRPTWSREDLNQLTKWIQEQGGKGLAWLKTGGGEPTSPIAKFFSDDLMKRLSERVKTSDGETVFLIADKPANAYQLADALRRHLARKLELVPEGKNEFLWITDFPLLEYNEEEGRWTAMHHPFTAPDEKHLKQLESDPGSVRARAYDLVLNGVEVGGGSIRIHQRELQERIFKTLGISPEEAQAKFSFLLDALSFGAPPHGGLALGLDRLIMMMLGLATIRDTIAFPKTQKGTCLVTGAPAGVSDRQLKDLYLKSSKP